MRSAGVCHRTSPPRGDDPPLELLERDRRPGDAGIGREQHGVFEPHAPPAARCLGAVEQIGGDAALAQLLVDRDQAAAGAPERGAGAVRDQPVQAQQRLAVRGAERVPALARPGEQVEVVLVGVGVVEVAGRAVRCAAGVSAREPLEDEGPLAAPGERPRGRQPHHSAADHHEGHAFAHPIDLRRRSVFRVRRAARASRSDEPPPVG